MNKLLSPTTERFNEIVWISTWIKYAKHLFTHNLFQGSHFSEFTSILLLLQELFWWTSFNLIGGSIFSSKTPINHEHFSHRFYELVSISGDQCFRQVPQLVPKQTQYRLTRFRNREELFLFGRLDNWDQLLSNSRKAGFDKNRLLRSRTLLLDG
jgi:hypothetical protein